MYTVLIDDHVVDLPLSIMEEPVFFRVLAHFKFSVANVVLSILNAVARETNTFQRDT